MARPPNTLSPAIATLASLLGEILPAIPATAWRSGSTHGDGHFGPDRHTAGLAIDIMLDSRDDDEKALADILIRIFVELHSQMQWYDLIYVDWPGGKMRPFHMPGQVPPYGGRQFNKETSVDLATGMAHRNHVHLDWCDPYKKAADPADVYDWPAEARLTTFKAALRSRLESLRDAFKPQATPAWLQGWWSINFDGEVYYYYFDRLSGVTWTQRNPGTDRSPLQNYEGKGNVAIGTPAGGLTIWWKSGNREAFSRIAGKPERIRGMWNDDAPIDGVKI